MGWRLAVLIACVVCLAEMNGARAAAALTCIAAGQAYDKDLAAFAAEIASHKSPLPQPQEGDGVVPRQSLAGAQSRVASVEAASGKDSREAAAALLDLAIVARDLARYGEALLSVERSITILQHLEPGGELQADAFRERGIVLSRLRKREPALADFDRAIAIYGVTGGAEAKMALTSRSKADILRGLNRFNEALRALSVARRAYEKDQPAQAIDLAETLIDTSIIHARLDDRLAALALAEEAARIATERLGPANRTAARALHNVGISLRRLDRFEEALAAFARAYTIYITPGPASTIRSAEALEDVSVTFSRLGCFDRAIALQTTARRAYETHYGHAHDRIAAAQHRLAGLLAGAGKSDEALQTYDSAVAMFDELLGPENPRSAKVYGDMATLHSSLGHAAEAVAYGFLTVRILGQDGGPDDLRQSLWSMARILKAQGNTPGAILFAKKAVNKQQEIRAANRELPPELAKALAERYRELYMYLASLLIEDGRLEEAQRTLDLIKQQEIIDFVRGEKPEATPVDSRAPLTGTERKASEHIDSLLLKPIAASKELEKLLARAKAGPLNPAEDARLAELKQQYYNDYKAFQNDVKKLLDGLKSENASVQSEVVKLHLDMLGQTRRKLKQFGGRAVLLQIASLDQAVHIFLTTPYAQVHRSVDVPRARMAQLAFEAWHGTARREPDADSKLAALYDILIRPVASDLKASGAEVVMLDLEGFLRYVPFAALYDGQRYLIEDYALTLQTPAADTVYAEGERDRTRAAGFGVTEASGEFPGLPGVAQELEAIFDGGDASGVLGGKPEMNGDFTAAHFAAALEARPLYVHIASHFKLTPGDESQSFLLLGNGERLNLETIRTDARFQFGEVDLLTLSACETAGEVGTDGKEVESFATLAQGAGASSVLATLWPIADESTARLMSDFYEALLVAGLDKAMALRHAQVAMIRGEASSAVAMNVARGVKAAGDDGSEAAPPIPPSHPYYWSAFILMGNWL